MRQGGGEGLPLVRCFGGDARACSDGAAAYVKEDKCGDDERVAGDVAVLRIGMKQGVRVELEIAPRGKQEAAQDQCDYADEDQQAEDIGEQVVDGSWRGCG